MNWEKETGLILKTALFKDATILSIWAWIYPQQINVEAETWEGLCPLMLRQFNNLLNGLKKLVSIHKEDLWS